MTRYGYFLSCEENSPAELIQQAKLAEEAGFDALWISDHYHPWLEAQGHSAFTWSLLAAILLLALLLRRHARAAV